MTVRQRRAPMRVMVKLRSVREAEHHHDGETEQPGRKEHHVRHARSIALATQAKTQRMLLAVDGTDQQPSDLSGSQQASTSTRAKVDRKVLGIDRDDWKPRALIAQVNDARVRKIHPSVVISKELGANRCELPG